MEWELDNTLIKDVIAKIFSKELEEGKKVKLLFAGKVMNEDKTLKESNVLDKYCLHAIIKNSNQNANFENNNSIQDENGKLYIHI